MRFNHNRNRPLITSNHILAVLLVIGFFMITKRLFFAPIVYPDSTVLATKYTCSEFSVTGELVQTQEGEFCKVRGDLSQDVGAVWMIRTGDPKNPIYLQLLERNPRIEYSGKIKLEFSEWPHIFAEPMHQ